MSISLTSPSTFISTNPRSSLRFAPFCFPNTLHFQILDHKIRSPLNLASINAHQFTPRVSTSEEVGRRDIDVDVDVNVDSLLSTAELFCLVTSSLATAGFVLNSVKARSKSVFLAVFCDRIMVGAIVMLVAGVGIGACIRRRQWDQVNREKAKAALVVNLMEKADKLQQDWAILATLALLLASKHDKLWFRFKDTRERLKISIEETAALAQKTSEATQALTVRGDIMQKELDTFHKALLTMQGNLQKQLNLILTFGKTGKIWVSSQDHSGEESHTETHDPIDEPSNQDDVQDI